MNSAARKAHKRRLRRMLSLPVIEIRACAWGECGCRYVPLAVNQLYCPYCRVEAGKAIKREFNRRYGQLEEVKAKRRMSEKIKSKRHERRKRRLATKEGREKYNRYMREYLRNWKATAKGKACVAKSNMAALAAKAAGQLLSTLAILTEKLDDRAG